MTAVNSQQKFKICDKLKKDYNYKKVLNYLDINNIKYIYLEKNKINFKYS